MFDIYYKYKYNYTFVSFGYRFRSQFQESRLIEPELKLILTGLSIFYLESILFQLEFTQNLLMIGFESIRYPCTLLLIGP